MIIRLKDILLEIGVTYKIPESKKTLLYDFYLLNYLDFVINNFQSKREDEDLKNSVEYAVDLLYPSLKKELLNSVFFAIVAEIRHYPDYGPLADDEDPTNSPPNRLKNNKKLTSLWKNFFKRRPNVRDQVIFNRLKKRNKNRDVDPGGKQSYRYSYYNGLEAMDKTNATPFDFISMAKIAFDNSGWENEYGGKPWVNICDGWLRLNAAQNKNDMAIAIDHVYDLQHNTDTVFNKLNSYYDKSETHKWISIALEHKANVKSYYELLNFASSSMKKMTFAVLKNYMGQDYESYLKLSPSNKSNLKNKTKKHNTSKIWPGGIWKGETWENGTWENGVWQGGIWKTGTWKDGIWENGIWEDGTWEDGIWEYGFWKNGTWEDGTWENGVWENGYWNNGFWDAGWWKKGTWRSGWIYDPTNNSPDSIKHKENSDYVYSKYNPEIYFNQRRFQRHR